MGYMVSVSFINHYKNCTHICCPIAHADVTKTISTSQLTDNMKFYFGLKTEVGEGNSGW
jgi:hypothetical protein